jgi:hypothetical protein
VKDAVNRWAAERDGYSYGPYRWRTLLRIHLPFRLLWIAPKGRKDCGNHDWYNADGVVEKCYHCRVGERPHRTA